MKLAIGFSTKDQVDLTRKTWERLVDSIPKYDPIIEILWADASTTAEAVEYWDEHTMSLTRAECVAGGADAAIAWKLTKALQVRDATHIMLLENDVLLDEDWFEPTMELFEKGKADGFDVGAVSARSYVDRVLIQRDGYAVVHNIGAGHIIFTREAAEIVLRSFRTNYWPINRLLFAQLSGIDLATYAAFRGGEHFVTTDWGWEAQLASHGLASLALTPAKCQMIGQNPPLEQQGLTLTGTSRGFQEPRANDEAFAYYRAALTTIRKGRAKTGLPGIIHRDGAGMLFFPHQLGYLEGGPIWNGSLELAWQQGFGPFAYRAGPGGASLSLRISSSSQFLVTGGAAGARVAIKDTRSDFNFAPTLPPATDIVTLAVPGGPIPRRIELVLEEGAVFHGVSTSDPQMLDTTFSFNWDQLPEAK